MHPCNTWSMEYSPEFREFLSCRFQLKLYTIQGQGGIFDKNYLFRGSFIQIFFQGHSDVDYLFRGIFDVYNIFRGLSDEDYLFSGFFIQIIFSGASASNCDSGISDGSPGPQVENYCDNRDKHIHHGTADADTVYDALSII